MKIPIKAFKLTHILGQPCGFQVYRTSIFEGFREAPAPAGTAKGKKSKKKAKKARGKTGKGVDLLATAELDFSEDSLRDSDSNTE
jgi:hypothetical protein